MAKIKKESANPIVAALLTWLVFNLGHLIINGQQRKWLFTLIAICVGFICCALPGVILLIMSIIDAFLTAQRLQKGEEIDENEYTFAPLFKIMKLVDKTAVGPA